MTNEELYQILDISSPEEFTYYENMAALLEEEREIDEDRIRELVEQAGTETFRELTASYFEEFLNRIPDEESDLYLLTDTMKRVFAGADTADAITDAIYRFRKWYVIDKRVRERNTGEELSVRDARYNLSAAKFTGEYPDYNYDDAYQTGLDGYDVRVRDMIEGTSL